MVHSERMQRKLQVECSKLRKQVETLADLNKQLRVGGKIMNQEEPTVGKDFLGRKLNLRYTPTALPDADFSPVGPSELIKN